MLNPQLVLHKHKKKKGKSQANESESCNDDLEALMARRLPRVKGKYKGKLHVIYFSCNKVGHIATRCPNRDEKDERKDNKFKG